MSGGLTAAIGPGRDKATRGPDVQGVRAARPVTGTASSGRDTGHAQIWPTADRPRCDTHHPFSPGMSHPPSPWLTQTVDGRGSSADTPARAPRRAVLAAGSTGSRPDVSTGASRHRLAAARNAHCRAIDSSRRRTLGRGALAMEGGAHAARPRAGEGPFSGATRARPASGGRAPAHPPRGRGRATRGRQLPVTNGRRRVLVRPRRLLLLDGIRRGVRARRARGAGSRCRDLAADLRRTDARASATREGAHRPAGRGVRLPADSLAPGRGRCGCHDRGPRVPACSAPRSRRSRSRA